MEFMSLTVILHSRCWSKNTMTKLFKTNSLEQMQNIEQIVQASKNKMTVQNEMEWR